MVLFCKKERLAFFLAFAATLCWLQPLSAGDETARRDQALRDLAAASAQAARLADARAQQAAQLRDVTAQVQREADRLAAATRAQAEADSGLARAQKSFVALLPLMLSVSRNPIEAVLASPLPPAQAVQGLLIARGMAITLSRQAAALRNEQARATAARVETAARAAALAQIRAVQSAREAALDHVVILARDQVTQAEAQGREAAEAVAKAAAQAATLREAIAAMDAKAAREAAAAGRAASAADKRREAGAAQAARARQAAVTRPGGAAVSGMAAPVSGTVLRGFGAPAEDGPATGMTYQAASGAFVTAPCQGRVGFAAPFRSYGRLIILECAGGLDVVLAGLASIAANPGHAVRQGEPLGRLQDVPGARLYVELRQAGRPVDPAPFLKAKS